MTGKVKNEIRWRRSDEGYTEDYSGRFFISPLYMGTSTIQGYQIYDKKVGRTWSGDNQRNLKSGAEDIVLKELHR
jgi:hypothetical protein